MGNCPWNCGSIETAPQATFRDATHKFRKTGLCQSRAVDLSARRPDGSQLCLRLAFKRDVWRRRPLPVPTRPKQPKIHHAVSHGSSLHWERDVGIRAWNQDGCVEGGWVSGQRRAESQRDRCHGSSPSHETHRFRVLGFCGETVK